MTRNQWNDLCLPDAYQDLSWELFHENSKTPRYEAPPSNEEILTRMAQLQESLPYESYPIIELPSERSPVRAPLEEVLSTRTSARAIRSGSLRLQDVATLLHYAYGITRSNAGTVYPRPFRAVPSGGALYPLEIFFHSTQITGLSAGIYHYNPTRNHLRRLREGDQSRKLADSLVQKNLALDTSIIFIITALFERSVFKYGDRGYRFVLMEAGHVAQNLNLVATGLGLASVNIGGFFDRQVDELLGLDGLVHSTVYLTGIGQSVPEAVVAGGHP